MNKNIHKNSFTLLELLIVISIISLLAAMLMPALAKAREKTRQSVCMGHLRQLGMAFFMYAQDYNGYLPAAMNTAGKYWYATRWRNGTVVPKYIDNRKAQICPTLKSLYPAHTMGELRSYGLNTYYFKWCAGSDVHHRLSEIKRPSDIILIGDGYIMNIAICFLSRIGPESEPDIIAGGVVNIGPDYPPFVHSKGTNVSFFDGHSSWLTREEFNKSDHWQ